MKIFQIKGDINNHKTQKEQISIVKDYSDTIKQNLDNLTYSDKTYICRKVLEKVVVKNNLIEVYTSIPIMAYQDYSRVG